MKYGKILGIFLFVDLFTMLASGQTTEQARVMDTAGTLTTNSMFMNISAVGQPYTTGLAENFQHIVHSGFLNALLLHTNLDTDADGMIDENDLDDDGDGLDDLTELAGDRFVATTPTDPYNPDTDGDGAIDGDEAGAQTDPRDPNNVFKIVDSNYTNGMFSLTWNSRGGVLYRVFKASSLTNLIDDATPVGTKLANGGVNPWRQTLSGYTNAEANPRAFYFIKIQ